MMLIYMLNSWIGNSNAPFWITNGLMADWMD